MSVAAARAAAGRETTENPTAAEPATATPEDAAAKPAPAEKPAAAPRREAIMGATPRTGRRGVSPAGLAIALAILLLGALTLWAMLSPTPHDDAQPGRPAAAGPDAGLGPRPVAAPAAASVAEPAVRATVGVGAEPIAVTAMAGSALVAVRGGDRLVQLDAANDAVSGEIPLPGTPQGVTASPDGTRAFVSTVADGRGRIDVVDVAGRKALNTVPVSGDPGTAVTSEDGRFLYVPSRDADVVEEVDPYAEVVTRTAPVDPTPTAAAMSAAGDRMFLTARGDAHLTVLDPDSLTVLGRFPVSGGAESVAVTPASVPQPQIAVAGPDSDTVTVLTPEGREVASVDAAAGPTGLAFAADGRHLYVISRQGLQIIDTTTWRVTGATDVVLRPTGIAVSPDGRTGWVSGDGAVSVLNLA